MGGNVNNKPMNRPRGEGGGRRRGLDEQGREGDECDRGGEKGNKVERVAKVVMRERT